MSFNGTRFDDFYPKQKNMGGTFLRVAIRSDLAQMTVWPATFRYKIWRLRESFLPLQPRLMKFFY